MKRFLRDSLYDTIVFSLFAIDIIGLTIIIFVTITLLIPWYLGVVFFFIGMWCFSFLVRALL
jgi:hypothetical protein